MNPLSVWREEVRALIPRGFLRRDRGEAALISDYPRYPGALAVTEKLRAAGFAVRLAGEGAHLDGTEEKYAQLLAALPKTVPPPTPDTLFLYSLAQRLMREEAPLRLQPRELLSLTLKALDAGEEEMLYQKLAPQIALLQRRRQTLPAAAGAMILAKLTEKGEEESC